MSLLQLLYQTATDLTGTLGTWRRAVSRIADDVDRFGLRNRMTIAEVEGLPGPRGPQSAYIAETDAVYEWLPGDASTIDHWTVLGATGGAAGRWKIQGSIAWLAPIGGGADDWSRLFNPTIAPEQGACTAFAAAGIWVGLRGDAGDWQCETAQTTPSNLTLVGTATTHIVSSLPPLDGGRNSPFYASGFAGQTIVTRLNADAVQGSRTLVVVSAVGLAIGNLISVQPHAAADGDVATYQITNIVGTTLTVERPILKPLKSGFDVAVCVAFPTNIKIFGNGMTISGTGDRAVEFLSARSCYIADVIVNSSFSSFGVSYDLATLDSQLERLLINFVANEHVGLSIEECEHCTVRDVRVNGAFSLVGIEWNANEFCDAYSVVVEGAAQDGWSVDTELGSARGNTNCRFFGCSAISSGLRGLVVADGATDCDFFGFTSQYSAGDGVAMVTISGNAPAPSDIRFHGCVFANGGRFGANLGVGTRYKFTACRFDSNGQPFGSFFLGNNVVLSFSDLDTNETGPVFVTRAGQGDGALVTGHGWTCRSTFNGFYAPFDSRAAAPIFDISRATFAINGTGFKELAIVFNGTVLYARDWTLLTAINTAFEADTGGTIRIMDTCSLDLAVTFFANDGAGFINRNTVVANTTTPVVVAWPDLKKTDRVQLQLQTIAGIAAQIALPLVVQTPGVGFSITSLALDTSTYKYTIN